jgi:hypothetical protein
MAVHSWQRGPRGSGGCRAGVAAATSRLDRGEARSPGPSARPGGSARTRRGRPHADLMSGQGNRGRGRGRPSRLRVASRPQTLPGRPYHRGVRWHVPCGSGLAVPAYLVGWSEPGNQARAVTARERPEDPPARGDHHPARIGDRQGPEMQLLAQARRRPSVHPADLRLALPSVPHPRPAVLQPRRPAVPGARHRAASGGTGPAVADQRDDEGRQCPGRSGP